MKFLLVTAVALLSTVVADEVKRSYSLPSNSPNGFRTHEIDAYGNPNNTHIPNFNATQPSITPSAKFSRRGSSGQSGIITCKNQYTLNYNDMIIAQQGLDQAFQNGDSFSGKSTSYKSDSAVAYGCNYGNGQTINGNWLAAQWALIAQNCGTSSPGYISFPQWKAAYGIDSSGVPFC
jgi:hypothetical protein